MSNYWPTPSEGDKSPRHKSRLLTDAEVSAIREILPFGPPFEPYAEVVAERFGCSYLTICNIGAGLSYRRPKACPDDHPLRLSLNERNASRQRERAKITPALKKEIGERQEWRCVYCFRDISKKASPDHIIPLAQGGDSSADNVQLTCLRCNTSKGALSDSEYRAKLNRIQQALYRKDLKAQRLGFDSHESMEQVLNEILVPIARLLLWADSTDAECLWCQGPTKPVGNHRELGMGPDATVFRCSACKRSFCVANWRGWEELGTELGWVLQGEEWADEDVVQLVKSVARKDIVGVSNLLATLAGDIQEVRNRRHRHRKSDGCWCEFDGSPFVEIGPPCQQSGLLSSIIQE